MIHPARLHIALSKNSKPSSQRDRLVLRSSELFAVSQESHILPCVGSLKSLLLQRTKLISTITYRLLLFVVSVSPIKTHSTRTLQRFSPIHF